MKKYRKLLLLKAVLNGSPFLSAFFYLTMTRLYLIRTHVLVKGYNEGRPVYFWLGLFFAILFFISFFWLYKDREEETRINSLAFFWQLPKPAYAIYVIFAVLCLRASIDILTLIIPIGLFLIFYPVPHYICAFIYTGIYKLEDNEFDKKLLDDRKELKRVYLTKYPEIEDKISKIVE